MQGNVEHTHCCSPDKEQPSSRRRFLGTAAALGALGGLGLASGEGVVGNAHAADLPAAGPDSKDAATVTRTNAIVQTATLINASPVIESAVKSGSLKVVPAVYDVGTSKVELLDIPPSIRLAGR